MQIIKPISLGITSRVVETQNRFSLCISAMLYFPFSHQGEEALWSEPSMWSWLALQGVPLIDEGIAKTTPEFLVHGYAYPPQGSASACAVRAEVGSTDKTLLVYGARYWKDGKPSAPATFSEMPLNWNRAYGGADILENPLGFGSSKSIQHGLEEFWLPNIEDPHHPLERPHQRVKPIGFGPIDPMWPQRARFRGTYDDRWLKEEAPAYPSDLHWQHFNLASQDQWFPQGLEGNEPFSFYNMHPQESLVSGQLPGLTARCLIRFGPSAPNASYCDVPMKLTTLWFFPHAKCAIAIVQGLCIVHEDDASDVSLLFAAVERVGRPLSRDHYLEIIKQREDPVVGAVHALNDSDLVPEGLSTIDPIMEDAKKEYALEGFSIDKQFRRAELQVEKLREDAKKRGLDPDALNIKMPEREKLPTPEQLPAYISQALEQAEKTKLQSIAQAHKDLTQAEKLAKASGIEGGEHRGPPTFNAAAELKRVQVSMGPRATPNVLNQLKTQFIQTESGMRLNYLMGAHLQSPAPPATEETTKKLRVVLAHLHTTQGKAHALNLTGINLNGTKLEGLDLTTAHMESISLIDASLEKANLSYAVLAHARAEGLQAAGAIFLGANLGKACLNKANLVGANLESTILSGTSFVEANLADARLTDARCDEAIFTKADLSRVWATGLVFTKTNFEDLKLCDANLSHCTFLECIFTRCDFSGAKINNASFVGCRFKDIKAQKVSFIQTSFVQACQFEGLDATQGKLERVNLRGASLIAARLEDAILINADLSEADLSEAILWGTNLRNAMAIRTQFNNAQLFKANLSGAILRNADFRGANLQGANLYGSDLTRIYRDEKTVFSEANFDRAKIKPFRSESATSS